MTLPVLHLRLPDELNEQFKIEASVTTPNVTGPVLPLLNRLNVFVGPNNSGKSRLLRAMFANPSPTFAPHSENQTIAYNLIKLVSLGLSPERLPDHKNDIEEFQRRLSALKPNLMMIQNQPREREAAERVAQSFREFTLPQTLSFRDLPTGCEEFPTWKVALKQLRQLADDIVHPVKSQPVGAAHIYIPTLRGLRPVSDASVFARRTYLDYFAPRSSDEHRARRVSKAEAELDCDGVGIPLLFTGEQMYDIVHRMLLGTLSQRRAIVKFQDYLRQFFNGDDVTLIPRLDDKKSLVIKIGEEEERPVHELGDGLQHMIIQTFPLFIHADKPLLLFIEEPELYLHPGFQRLLIDAFVRNPEQPHQIFVATHSHHFLDLTLDRSACSFFRVTKDYKNLVAAGVPKHRITCVSDEGRHCLQDLGVWNSSVLLSNCTIWVEGTTDRRYLQRYLEIYQRVSGDLGADEPFVEDLHYSFVEYSGGNIVHWSFSGEDGDKVRADRLSQNIFVIMDNDNAEDGSEKWERGKRLEVLLGDRFVWLECTEIENLLTPEVILQVIDAYEGESPKVAITRDFEQESYFSEKLGRFIDTIILDDPKKSRRNRSSGTGYSAPSGTVKSKVDFCAHAIERISQRAQMSSHAWELAKRLFEFIRANNPITRLKA